MYKDLLSLCLELLDLLVLVLVLDLFERPERERVLEREPLESPLVVDEFPDTILTLSPNYKRTRNLGYRTCRSTTSRVESEDSVSC